jgi:hypothetical protein
VRDKHTEAKRNKETKKQIHKEIKRGNVRDGDKETDRDRETRRYR